ncbi:hypothetical protein J6Y73_02570 [bacterium]|nr:hypothetical protein [bacterium]
MNSAYGLVHDYYPRERMISIKLENKLSFFYFPRHLYKIFYKSMTYKSVYIFFSYSDDIKILKGAEAKLVTDIEKIEYQSKKGLITVFNKQEKLLTHREEINSYEYKMFLDFEFTMPEYGEKQPDFISELLQIGVVISDKDDVIVNEYSNYIKTLNPVSLRTKRFLRIDDKDLEDAISAEDFYNDYLRLINIYNPVIFVWGGNDTKVLSAFYKLHKFKKISAEYIDLVSLIRKHYELKSDIGLFNALKVFNDIEATQAHHALTDAAATKEIFDSYKKLLNGDHDIDLKEKLKELKSKEEEILEEIEEQ